MSSIYMQSYRPQVAMATGIDGVTPLQDAGQAPDGLTPDMLMLYCKRRLQGLDTEIRNAMDSQQKMNGIKAEISQLESKIGSLKDGPQNQAVLDDLNNQIDSLLKQVGADSPIGKELSDTKTKLNTDGQGGTDNIVTSDEIKTMQDSLKQANATIDSDAELQMMQLQSVMSQRQTAIQLTTNLIQTMSDTTRKVAENIGH